MSDSSLIIHYDGIRWKEEEIERGAPLNDTRGSSANDIWAVGSNKTVYHYNGINWIKDTVIQLMLPNGIQFGSVASLNSTTYLIGSYVNSNYYQVFYFISYKNSAWYVIDSFEVSASQTKFGTSYLWASPNNNLYSCGYDGIFKWNNYSWINVFAFSPFLRMIGEKASKAYLQFKAGMFTTLMETIFTNSSKLQTIMLFILAYGYFKAMYLLLGIHWEDFQTIQ